MKRAGAAAAAAKGAGAAALGLLTCTRAEAAEFGPLQPGERRDRCFQIRTDMAAGDRSLPMPDHLNNGDEERFPLKIGNFSKGLPHTALGEPYLGAYSQLVAALSSGRPADFDQIQMGCPDPAIRRRLVNPQSGLAFDLEGSDSHQLFQPPAPAFSSPEQAADAIELYWMALARDVAFTEYGSDPITAAAAAELSILSGFRGPRDLGVVATSKLFRGFTAGDLRGPYISQFLLKTIPYGAQTVDQHIRTTLPGADYMTRFAEWLDVQNGFQPAASEQFDPVRRYIRNGRDLAQWVHMDVLFQAYFSAGVLLLVPAAQGGIGASLNRGNPYASSDTQDGFGTFGGPHIAALVAEVATRALKAVWYQKWYVHRRLRPEEFGGRAHIALTGAADYPVHQDVVNSAKSPDGALSRTFASKGTYLLPQAYPEGSPLHPSYGAGHATVAGACVTILKAFFDESFVIADPVVPSLDGLSLKPYSGPALTVGGELNKLAANIATGRNFAGIHYRSDYTESLKLGEAVALSILKDQAPTYNERFNGFTFTRFDGTKITV